MFAEADVLGVRIRRRSREEALEGIGSLLEKEGPHSLYFVHAATANLAFEDPAYRDVLNRGSLVLNDGIGVRWAARWNGLTLQQNLLGTDLLPQLFEQESPRPLRIYLLGGRPGVAERAAAYMRNQFPRVEVVGWHDGYFSPSEEPWLIENINQQTPDLLLVGMGNPLQECFIDRHLPELRARVVAGVGGLLDHFAGEISRAAPWVRRMGLEWLQLLLQQPHKGRRYLLGIPKFLWRSSRAARGRLLQKALLAGLALSLAVVSTEAMVRLLQPQILERYPPGLYVASPSRQYKLRPGFQGRFRYPEFQTLVRINSQGLREDREYGLPAGGARRILAVGDSFTFNYSVEQEHTWVRRLEKLLRERVPAARYEVLNAGTPGYSTWQELAYIEEEGIELDPQIILLAFFLGNDITDNAQPLLPVRLREGRLLAVDAEAGLLPGSFRILLARHSHLYHLAWRARHRSGHRGVAARYAAFAGQSEAGWKATAALLQRLARLCAARKVRPIVVLIPERAQVEVEAGRRLAAELDRAGVTWDPGWPNRRMRQLCRQVGVEAIDLLDTLAGTGLYFAQDGHWTPGGNAKAARAVSDYLTP